VAEDEACRGGKSTVRFWKRRFDWKAPLQEGVGLENQKLRTASVFMRETLPRFGLRGARACKIMTLEDVIDKPACHIVESEVMDVRVNRRVKRKAYVTCDVPVSEITATLIFLALYGPQSNPQKLVVR
jgi:hypothetical protein